MPATLSPTEIRALCLYKARYSLEARGLSRAEAARILFLRWLVHTKRITP